VSNAESSSMLSIIVTNTPDSVVSAGIVRTYYLVRVESSDIDKTWNGFNVFVAGIAELNLGIMCACAPSIQHFFKGFLRNLATKISSISGYSSSNSGVQNQVRARVGKSLGSTDLESSCVEVDNEVERWADKESGSTDPRKYRTTPIHTNFKTPVLSPATSQLPRTGQNPTDVLNQRSRAHLRVPSAQRGSSPNIVRPGFIYLDGDEDSDIYSNDERGVEDWTNSSKFVV
jgi:hypothetical protein